MRKIKIVPVLILLAFILVYGSLCFYIGKVNFLTFSSLNPNMNATLYWVTFIIIASSCIIGMLLNNKHKGKLSNIFLNIGFAWIAFFYYFLLIIFVIDILKLFIVHFHFVHKTSMFYSLMLHYSGLLALFIVILIAIYGVYIGTKRVVTTYDLEVKKGKSQLEMLNIAMVSDIHLGTGFGMNSLYKMAQNINALKPDIIFICGDLIDENTTEALKENFPSALKKLTSKYGTYAILGNHEYGADDTSVTIERFKLSNVKLLKDELINIDNSFYIIGRDDFSTERANKKARIDISSILANYTMKLPVIVLDHQPVTISNSEKRLIDLQLSGHTHHGQFFPNNLITKAIFDDSYGYLRDDNYQLIVSSGYGTWGPLIRIGSKCEIVNIKLTFK